MQRKYIFGGIAIIMVMAGIIVFGLRNPAYYVRNDSYDETYLSEKQRTVEFTENEGQSMYIGLVDRYVDDAARSKLYHEKDAMARLKQFNEELNQNFEYHEVLFQVLQCLDYYDGDEQFVKIYNSKGGKIHNQRITIDGKKRYVTSLNAVQVNKRFFDANLMFLESGNGFDDDDYLFSESKDIPVILGYHYKKDMNIGDTFTLNYLNKDLQFCVSGFFQEGLTIQSNTMVAEMDNYICMPSFSFAETMEVTEVPEEEFLFRIRHSLQKNSGYIGYESEQDLENIKKRLELLVDDYGLQYEILGMTYQISTCIEAL